MFVGVHTIVANSSPFNMIVRGDSMTMHSSSGANESPWNRITLQPFSIISSICAPPCLKSFQFRVLGPFFQHTAYLFPHKPFLPFRRWRRHCTPGSLHVLHKRLAG